MKTGNGPINPIYSLALKHKLVTTTNNWEDIQFYDEKGHADFGDSVRIPSPPGLSSPEA